MLKSGRLSKAERAALTHFAAGGRERPFGVGDRTIRNLQARKWVVWGRDELDGPEVYAITPLGRAALENDRALDTT